MCPSGLGLANRNLVLAAAYFDLHFPFALDRYFYSLFSPSALSLPSCRPLHLSHYVSIP